MSLPRILVTEDDAVLAADLGRTLTRLGYEVVALVASGEDAVAQATACAPDVVLMDIRLRDRMTGLEAAAEIRRRLDVPVVYLTAHTDDALVAEATATEPYGYLVKPVRESDLRTALKVALHRSETDRRLRHLTQVLRAVREVDRLVAREVDATRLLEQACQVLVHTQGYPLAWVSAAPAAAAAGPLPVRAWAGQDTAFLATLMSAAAAGSAPTAPDPCAAALASGRPLVTRDLGRDPAFARWQQAATACGYGAAAVIPMVHAGRPYGALGVVASEARVLGDDVVDLLGGLADDLAHALHALDEEARRLAAEAALRQSEAELRLVWDSALDGMRLSDADGTVHRVNDAYCRMVGVPREELEGRPLSMAYAESTREAVLLAYIRNVRGHTIPPHLETHVALRDGRRLTVELSSVQLPVPGQPDLVLSVFRDLSERRRAEGERLRLERQLLHAQKLESLGVLAGGIAHDFNNILTAILGNLCLALDDLPPVSPARDEVLEAEAATRRAAELTKQMLAYSGKGRFQVVRLGLNGAIDEIAHMLRVSVSKNALLHFHYATGLPCIDVDATQLRQVIMNLVINASEAIGERSGVIAVSTGAMDCGREYLQEPWHQDSAAPGLYVFLEVADTGCGVPPENVGRLFDPFFTTKFTGRGLGLAAVLGIVRGHHGAIKVESEVGKGSTFRVLLPAAEEPLAVVTDPAAEPSSWHGSGTVLLVDDEPTIRATGRRMLERLGFRVLVAADGREAVEVFRAEADGIACVLLDLAMPHMGGEEAFRELRRIRPQVRVILSSGYDQEAAAARFTGGGLAGFMQKPYTLENLRRMLQRVCSVPGRSV